MTIPDSPATVVYFDHTGRLGGGERSLLDLLARIDRALVRPLVVTGQPGNLVAEFEGAGVPVRVLGLDRDLASASRRFPGRLALALTRPGPFFDAARKLARILRGERARILHTNSQKAHWIGLVAGRLARVPVVWHFRDILEPAPLALASAVGTRFAAATLAISEAVREALGRGPRVRVVPNGISLDRGPVAAPELAAGAPGPLVGMVSQLARWKGPEVFLEAAARIGRERTDVRFVLVGGVLFPESEGNYERELRERAVSLGLEGRLFFAGPVGDARAWIGSFACLVHPPVRPEPFGRVVLEAMAAGVPVVASRAGGVVELVSDGETGILVPPGDAPAHARAVLSLLADPERARAMGRRGREVAAARFSIDRTVGAVMEIYRELLGRSR
ncbi:MAG: glycosyltransferase family 4 protein [Planctomycetes bacterium]|nr:glycosyltransferase family 4 protein [Planctomycetota bacterium]